MFGYPDSSQPQAAVEMFSVVTKEDSLAIQEGYGDDVTIVTQNGEHITIIHKAKFANICCDSCNGTKARKYFWVEENAYESNYPVGCGCPPFCTIAPNACCPGDDFIRKTYFDRGVFDRQSCYWKCGWYNGPHSFHSNEIKQVCCCVDCCDCWNQYVSLQTSCWSSWCCGERVVVVPGTNWCFCCPTHACWLHNCFSLCGPKNGEPLIFSPFAHHLKEGEADKLLVAVGDARDGWASRTGRV